MATRLSRLPEGWVVAADTEGSGLRWDPPVNATVSVVSFAYRDPLDHSLVYKALAFDQGHVGNLGLGPKSLPSNHAKRVAKWDEWARDERIPNLSVRKFDRLLEVLSRHRLVFHNAKHDLHGLHAGLRGWPGRDLIECLESDTMLAQNRIQPQFPIGLKEVVEREFLWNDPQDEVEAMKPWLGPKNDPRYDLVPWKIIEEYAATDAAKTLLLYEWQINHIRPDVERHIAQDLRLMRSLYEMENRGIGFDVELANEMAKLLRAEKHAVAQTFPFKATGPGARKWFFEEAPDARPAYTDKMTGTGQPQIDEEVVSRLVAEGRPHAKEFQYHENLKSALAKWYEPWPKACGRDGRLRTNFNQASTVGGRLSANQVQLHAIPHDHQMPDLPGLVPVRGLFRPKPGYELWEVDVSQAEIRIGCAIAKCRGLLEGFREGLDAHSAATIQMFGIDTEDPMWDEFRQVAKRINLSIQYGAGPKKIREQILKFTGIDYSLKQVREWVDLWKDTYPEMVWAMEAEQQFAEEHSCIRLRDGRTRFFRDFELRTLYKAFNAKAQYTVACVMGDVMVDWDQLHPGTLLLQIHDSMVIEVPSFSAEVYVQDLQELMIRKFERFCARSWKKGEPQTVVPFKADAKHFGQVT